MSSPALALSLEDIRAAHARLQGKIERTPVFRSETLDRRSGARLVFKGELLQKTGAFKARGAANAVFSLSEGELARGVATHSSGNHAAALAWAASQRGAVAHVVMPRTSPQAKQDNVRRYGGRVILCEPTLEAREHTVARVVDETGAVLIHPYNDLRVMAGQGTAALELLEEVPDLDAIVCPVSGGGLLSGTAVAAKGVRPAIRVYGAEPLGADDAQRSLRAGRIIPMVGPKTIADGLQASLGSLVFPVVQALVDDIATVSEPGIVEAMRTIWDVLKLVAEPSGAVGLGVILEGALKVEGLRVGVILTGGNLDLDRLPWSPR